MIGTILTFDPVDGGLLRAEDGRRYAFAAAEWKSGEAPLAGIAVDFEPDDGTAFSLYALPVPAARGDSGPGAIFGERPGLPLAVLILLSCFLPFLSLGALSANLFNLVGVASTAGRYAPHVNMETGLWLFHGLYVVPLLALVLIVQEWRGRAGRWLRIGVGFVGLVGPVAIALGARTLFTVTTSPAGTAARLLRRLREYMPTDLLIPNVGVGWVAIGLLSLALILVGIFWPSPARTSRAATA